MEQKKERNKGGRPRKEMAERLDYRIGVKMVAADYFRLLTQAHDAGISPSEYSKIDAALQRNRYKERMELASVTKGYGLGQANTPTPSASGHGEFFSGSFGLLNGNSSYNATDTEANQEMAEILRRKKKRKRGMRL